MSKGAPARESQLCRRVEDDLGAIGLEGGGLRTDEGNVVLHIVAGKAWVVGDAAEGGDAREDRVGLNQQSAFPILRLSPYQSFPYLSATITRQSVVPQALVWARNGFLIMAVIAVGRHGGREGSNGSSKLEHVAIDRQVEDRKGDEGEKTQEEEEKEGVVISPS